MKKIIRLFTFLTITSTILSCSKNDTEQEKIDSIEWYINGVKFTNGNIQKSFSNSIIEVSESQNGLYLYLESFNQININTIYNSTNANVGITLDYTFEPNSIYDELNYGSTENVKILENNDEFIRGEFTATVATLLDNQTGETSVIDYDIENGKFKIYK
jgi:hypothetical protein